VPPKISFQIIDLESVFLHPQRDFQPRGRKIQVRFDPLTGRTGHLSHFGAIKPPELDLERYLDPEVKGFCPFCSEQRNGATPKFTKDILPEGRMSRGEALLVPNLYPYDIYSSVVIMIDDHMVPLHQFDYRRLYDSFSVGVEFLKKVKWIDPSLSYHVMAWNYMPPSGGGLVHPHQQYFASAYPGNQFTDELKSAELFFKKNKTDYWTELVSEEQNKGERYIGRLGNSEWLTSFVPLGVLGEIMAVFPGVYCIDSFNDQQIYELVEGILKIFLYYIEAGIYSFNASLFFGPAGQDFFPAHFRIVPRTFLNVRDYAPDLNFFQAVLAEPVSVVLPEDLCREVKPYFHHWDVK